MTKFKKGLIVLLALFALFFIGFAVNTSTAHATQYYDENVKYIVSYTADKKFVALGPDSLMQKTKEAQIGRAHV